MTDTGILWHSNAMHAPTGYGNQTGLFAPLLHQEEGQRLSISAFYGQQGGLSKSPEGIITYPMYMQNYGNDIIQGHMHHSRSDVVVSLIDPFVLDPQVWGQLNWCAWVPVDCAPVQAENLVAIQHAKWLWSMSKFGHEELKKALPDKEIFYVPHGINTDVYKPVDREESRAKLSKVVGADLTDKFIFISVAANKGTPSRKNFAGLLRAFAHIAREHDDAVLYLHTDPDGDRRGDHLPKMVEAYGLKGKVFFPPKYHYAMNLFPQEALNDFYNAADCFILLSYGEGFGIPIVEAQAAGCPVIVTEGSAMTELCMSGWTVKSVPIQALDGRYGSQWWMASPPHAIAAMKEAYEKRDDESLRSAAREKAVAYDYRKVYAEYMKPAMDAMLKAVKVAKEPQTDSRKRRKRNHPQLAKAS